MTSVSAIHPATRSELIYLVTQVRNDAVTLLEALYHSYPELRYFEPGTAAKGVWNEADHPRDEIGRFTENGGSRSYVRDRARDITPREVTPRQVRELAPRVPHPFSPQGTKVSGSVDVPPHAAEYASLALRAIDAVHGDGELDMAILGDKDEVTRGKMVEAGEYRATSVSDRPVLDILPNGPTRSLTLVHEIGHWLDHKMIGNNEMGTFQDAAELKSAIAKSQAVKILKSYSDKDKKAKREKKGSRATITGKEKRGTTVKYTIDGERTDYLLLPEELFARAYTQYVIQRGGDENLRRELASRIAAPTTTDRGGRTKEDLHYPTHWEPADFEPIAREFDKLFTAKGWMKPHV